MSDVAVCKTCGTLLNGALFECPYCGSDQVVIQDDGFDYYD